MNSECRIVILCSALFSTFLVLQPSDVYSATSLDRAKEIQAANEAELLRMPGVVGVGIGEDEQGAKVLHIYVKDGADTRQMPAALEELPVVLIPSEGFKAFADHRATYGFPVPMGVSTSNHLSCPGRTYAGTLGFRVCDANNRSIVGYITNTHVAAADANVCPTGAASGTAQYQAGSDDAGCGGGNLIGTLERFIPVNQGNNLVDAAFVRSDNVSPNILDIGLPQYPRDPRLNEQVRKSGRSTGVTSGQVQTVNWSGYVTYGDLDHPCFSSVFSGQIVITPGSFSQPGDSGAPIVGSGAGDPVGLLFAGDQVNFTLANPINQVKWSLNVRFACVETMAPGRRLYPDWSVTSPDGRFTFMYQSDGNLVLYRWDSIGIWASNTRGTSAGYTEMQGDGNLVVYDAGGVARWASNTPGQDGSFLSVQNDGNVVIYHPVTDMPLWATNTCCY